MEKEKITRENTIWMSQKEAELMKEFMTGATEEQFRRHAYFMWNNFSMEGYKEYMKKHDEKIKKAIQDEK